MNIGYMALLLSTAAGLFMLALPDGHRLHPALHCSVMMHRKKKEKKKGAVAPQRNPNTVQAKNFVSVRQRSSINSQFIWLAAAAWQYLH